MPPLTSFRILLGVGDTQPTVWDGSIKLSSGTVRSIQGWRFAVDGTRVSVTPLFEQGTTAALLAAILAPPHVTAEDVAEFEAILEAGKRPPSPAPIL